MEPALVIFDMDGTLSDTSEGIRMSWHQIAPGMNVPEPPGLDEALESGEPLFDVLRNRFGFEGNDVFKAARIFRSHYSSEGCLASIPYPGIRSAIQKLHDGGATLAVATMKLDEVAKKMVKSWGIDDILQIVHGSDLDGKLRKSDLINRCLEEVGIRPSEAVMVGDTEEDLRGAQATGVRFLAVTYGYGFTSVSCQELGVEFVDTAESIPSGIERLRGFCHDVWILTGRIPEGRSI